MTIFVIGSINIDDVYSLPHIVLPGETISSTSFQVFPGGKGANQSVALSRAKAPTTHFGKIGNDGDWVLKIMKNSGCNIDSVIVDKSIPTGKAVIQVAESGENAIILYPGTNHCISNQELQNLFEKIVKKNWIVCQNELGTQTTCLILEMGFQKGSIVCFNPAPCSMDLCESIDLKHVDILLLNSIESSQIASQLKMDEINKNTFLVQMMNEFTHLKIAVVTLGEKGAIASFRDNDSISTVTVSPSRAVKVVDTTGAGDTFVGYFLAHLYQLHKENDGALHDQNSIQEAMTIAILASGLACESFGAMSSIPTYESVYSYIKS